MKDDRKFRVTAIISLLLIVLILSYNILQEYYMTEIGGYLTRRAYYEKVISKKGLKLHKAKFWRNIEE
jgi:hypothetical protein